MPARFDIFHGEQLQFLPGWEEKLAAVGIAPGGNWRTIEPGERISRSKHVNVYRVTLDSGEVVYFKRYIYHHIKYLLYRNRALNEVRSYAALKKAGVPTMEAVAWGSLRRFGHMQGGCIVTREVPGTEDLEKFAAHHWCSMSRRERAEAIDRIGAGIITCLQRAHRQHFFHRDLKWRNILVGRDAAGAYAVTWIDSPSGRYMRLRHGRGIVEDLSALARLALSYLSRSQQLRFVRNYLGNDAGRDEVRALYRRVGRHLSRRWPDVFNPEENC